MKAIVAIKDEHTKFDVIYKLNRLGYKSELSSCSRNCEGSYLIIHDGCWHCTNVLDYLNNKEYFNCNDDINLFLEKVKI